MPDDWPPAAIEAALDVFYPHWRQSNGRHREGIEARMAQALRAAAAVQRGATVVVLPRHGRAPAPLRVIEP